MAGARGDPQSRASGSRLAGPTSAARDAPGEVAVATFRHAPAAARGVDCLDCHAATDRTDHRFPGPRTAPAMLEGAALLEMHLRRRDDGWHLLVRISNRAGHAIPGGTTGRALWLEVCGRTADGAETGCRHRRFG